MMLIVWIVSLMPISWANPKNPWKLPDISNDPKCGVCECFRAPIPELDHLNTMMADCSKLQLNAIPKELPDDIGFLNLEFNNIKQITKEVLPFPQLKFLCVKENSITSLQNDTFSNLNELEVLDVTGNRIMNIPKGIFQSLKKLRNIQGLYVDTVPVGMLSHLKLLQELQLTTEEAAVPVNLFKDISIEILSLHLPNATAVPVALFQSGHVTMKVLSIFGNKLRELGEDIFGRLSLLQKLHIQVGNISSLPLHIFHGKQQNVSNPESSNPSRLNSIAIDGVKRITDQLFRNLPSLEKLHIRNAESIHDETFWYLNRLDQLEMSSLSSNKLKSGWFRDITGLKSLNLSHNKIEVVPSEHFQRFLALEKLYLSHNLITLVEVDMLDNLRTSLTTFDLSHNKICNLPDGVFNSMWALKKIYLQNNCISNFTKYLFYDESDMNQRSKFAQKELLVVDLSNNDIHSLSLDFFLNLRKVQMLNLSNNNLTEIHYTHLPGSVRIETINLSGNDIHCSCDFLKFILIAKSGGSMIHGKCYFPDLNYKVTFKEDNIIYPSFCKVTAGPTEVSTMEEVTTEAAAQTTQAETTSEDVTTSVPDKTTVGQSTTEDITESKEFTTAEQITAENIMTREYVKKELSDMKDENKIPESDKKRLKVNKSINASYPIKEQRKMETKLTSPKGMSKLTWLHWIGVATGCGFVICAIPTTIYVIYKLRGILYKRHYPVPRNVQSDRANIL